MPPTNPELMELVYASKLLAKTIDEVDEKLAGAIDKIESQQESLAHAKELIGNVDKKLELLPLVLAEKLESLVERRTSEAFEDLRTTLNELRNKLYSIKKQIKDATGSHDLPTKAELAKWDEEKKEDGIEVVKGGFRMRLPFSEGTWKVIKVIGIIIGFVAGGGAVTGGIWALIDRVKHALTGGG